MKGTFLLFLTKVLESDSLRFEIGFISILIASMKLLVNSSALPQQAIRKYGNVAEACVACVASSGLAQHACNCCNSWDPQYCKS